MIFFFEENCLVNQYDNVKKNLNYLKESQSNSREVIYKCLLNLSPKLLNSSDVEHSDSLVALLENIKKLVLLIKSNLENIDILKKQLEHISKKSLEKELDEKTKVKLKNFNNKYEDLNSKIKLSSKCFHQVINSYITEYTLLSKTISQNPLTQTSEPIPSPMLKYKKVQENSLSNEIVKKSKNESSNDYSKIAVEKGSAEKKDTSTKNHNSDTTCDGQLQDNRVLLISEKQKRVFLPYNIKDLKSIQEKSNSYNSLQQIIDEEYTVPISKYSNSIIARFRETYNLMRKKEKSSVKDGIDLALELSFNSLLNPAIISACRNLDELDIYLDCLRTNELEKFNIFDIQYEFLPTKS